MSPHGKSVVLEPMGNSSQINLNFYENQALNPIIHLSCIFSYVKSRYYRDIATAILKRFPHLVKESIRYADTVDLWYGIIKHINNWFENKEGVPEILERGRLNQKSKLSDEDVEWPSGRMCCWRLSNFLPEIPEGEDDFTIKNYQRILKEQHNYTAIQHITKWWPYL